MKRISLIALLLMGIVQFAFARDGYHIHLKLTNTNDSVVYLAHYYGKPLPSPIYKTDSARLKHGVAILESDKAIVGGIYIIMLSDHKTYFEFLLNNGDNMNISASVNDLPQSVTFKSSPENDRFMKYVKFLREFGLKQRKYINELAQAHNKSDSTRIADQMRENSHSLVDFRRDYVKKYPNTLLTDIFNALELPQVPAGKHLLPDGEEDSSFAYDYYKAHYWDDFNFHDDRLINTPIYAAKLDEYMNKLVLPYPDSVEAESDKLLAKTHGSKELFKYTLWWLEHNAQDSKIMGMDAVVVYLVENYYMKGDATWLSNDELNKYIEYASKIAPNVLGNLAPEIKMPDMNGKEQSLLGLKAKYTLLIFWSAECGHCQHEIPLIDSVYNAVLKKEGVRVYAIRADGDEKKWKEFIQKHGLTDWVNVEDPDHTRQDFRSKYDVYSTPIIYMLDKNKIIIGKRLDHTNLQDVITMYEKKKEKEAKK